MQPAVIDEALAFPSFAPGATVTGLVVTLALGLTMFAARAAAAPALQDWHRWLNPLVVAAWLASLWMVGLRLLDSDSMPEMLARALILGIVLTAGLPLLRDVFGGLAIVLEGRIHLGDEVRIGEHHGRIVRLGLRSVVIRKDDRAELYVSNRRFSAVEIVRLDVSVRDAPCEFEVSVPRRIDIDAATRRLAEAATLSPYAAPGRVPEVFVVASHEGTLLVRVRGYVFDRAYEERFRGDVLARVDLAALESANPPA